MNGTNPPTAELLLQHVEWIRRLARELVADAGAVDDLVQETLTTALERPPLDARGLRSWLARVTRNLAFERARGARSREARERVAARDEALPDTAELSARMELERKLVERLASLPEPYRTALILRFYEDLPPRAIAQRTGAPVATVKSRLLRGLELLRAALDSDSPGGRHAWLAVLVPLARPAPVAPLVWLGGSLMVAKIVAALVLLVGVGFWLNARGPTSRDGAPSTNSTNVATPRGVERELERESPTRAAERESVASRAQLAPNAATSVAATTSEPSFFVRGRVLDGNGFALAGRTLSVRGDGSVDVASASDGSFEFETRVASGELAVADAAWVTVRRGAWSRDAARPSVVIAAPAIDVSGSVVDVDGAPLAGARVRLGLPRDFAARFRDALDGSPDLAWSTESDADGTFALRAAPAIEGASLLATKEGFDTSACEAPLGSLAGLRLVLVAHDALAANLLRGRVVDGLGAPAADARVSLGARCVRVDGDGLFALDLTHALDTSELVAARAGSLPARLARPKDPTATESGWPALVELRLGDATLSIRGRVVEANGAPVANVKVWLAEPTPFGAVGTAPLRLEALLAGGAVPERAIESLAAAPDADGEADFGSAGPLREANAQLYWVATDGDGRFELPGLERRDYTLRVVAPDLRFDFQSRPVRAGESIELVVAEPDAYPRIEGRVVTRLGDPVAGVELQAWTTALELDERVFGGRAHVSRFLAGPTTRSDANGRFALERVRRSDVFFEVSSDAILPLYVDVESLHDPLHVELVVAARAYLDVRGSATSRADAFELLDPRGERVKILSMRKDGYSDFERFALVDGNSGVVTTNTDAATLRLFVADEVTAELPLALRPGVVTSIDY
ncbi:MAG: sigma-70 family RNA polymerase sigma factor [Planctomycetes bacterium]|nr:sigma-70 family RNA polymerase sigma factor [Planctomycetota bacterium]